MKPDMAVVSDALVFLRALEAEIERRSKTSSDVALEGLRILLSDSRAENERLRDERKRLSAFVEVAKAYDRWPQRRQR